MKQESGNSKVYLDRNELESLAKETKETVAVDINLEKEEDKNIFSAADLWRIQRLTARAPRRSTFWN